MRVAVIGFESAYRVNQTQGVFDLLCLNQFPLWKDTAPDPSKIEMIIWNFP